MGEVSGPHDIRLDGTHAFDTVGNLLETVFFPGNNVFLPFELWFDVIFAHDAQDALLVDSELKGDATVAIGLMCLKDGQDTFSEERITIGVARTIIQRLS